jgi:hypothetical protein
MIKKFDAKCDSFNLGKLKGESTGPGTINDNLTPQAITKTKYKATFTTYDNDVFVIRQDNSSKFNIYSVHESDNLEFTSGNIHSIKPLKSDVPPENLASELKKVLNKKVLNKTGIVVNGVLTISEDTDYIGNCEYLCNDVITRVKIPSTCDVGDGAFMGCPNLEEVVFYDVKHEKNKNKKISIYPYAFFNCEKLEKIVLPETLKSIGKNAFGHCPIIKEFTLICVAFTFGGGNCEGRGGGRG